MSRLLFIFLFSSLTVNVLAGDTTVIYKPDANAKADIAAAIAKAKKEGKHVLLMAGGNWCSWCLRFNTLTTSDAQLDSALNTNYVLYHLNYSKENKNEAVFESLGFPQRFGFPVFIVLDANGNRIHTQNSAYLEEGKGYDKAKILEFLHHWRRAALLPSNYLKS
ncbi:MAG: thioredoxin family protein [Chitinophagaceae bacterium]|jgi:thioredoxin-related protein